MGARPLSGDDRNLGPGDLSCLILIRSDVLQRSSVVTRSTTQPYVSHLERTRRKRPPIERYAYPPPTRCRVPRDAALTKQGNPPPPPRRSDDPDPRSCQSRDCRSSRYLLGPQVVARSDAGMARLPRRMEVRHDDERKRHSVAFVLTVRASNTSAYARSTKAKYASNVDLCIWTLVIEMRLQVTIKSGEETETSGQPKRIDLEHTIKGGEEKKKRCPTTDQRSRVVLSLPVHRSQVLSRAESNMDDIKGGEEKKCPTKDLGSSIVYLSAPLFASVEASRLHGQSPRFKLGRAQSSWHVGRRNLSSIYLPASSRTFYHAPVSHMCLHGPRLPPHSSAPLWQHARRTSQNENHVCGSLRPETDGTSTNN